MKTIDTRYPYTYAADYIRGLIGYNEQGTILSRAQASNLYGNIAKILGMTHEEMAKKLADAELDGDIDKEVSDGMKVMGL